MVEILEREGRWQLRNNICGMGLESQFVRTHRNVCTECVIYYGACQRTRYPWLFDERGDWLAEARCRGGVSNCLSGYLTHLVVVF